VALTTDAKLVGRYARADTGAGQTDTGESKAIAINSQNDMVKTRTDPGH